VVQLASLLGGILERDLRRHLTSAHAIKALLSRSLDRKAYFNLREAQRFGLNEPKPL
jgi:hypothetical protein